MEYKQVEFEATRNMPRAEVFRRTCFDCCGNEIQEGCYVIPMTQETKAQGIEGYVKEIVHPDCFASYIKIVTHGGMEIESHGNPTCFAVANSRG